MMHPNNRSPARFEGPLNTIHRGFNKLYSMWIQATYPFASSGRELSIHFPCELSRRVAHQIELGNSVILRKDTWLNVVPSLSNELKIIIEDNCVIGARNLISAKNCIHVEHDVIFSSSVLVQDHAHAYENIKLPIRAQGVTAGGRIRIEQGCWIGKGVSIVCNDGELVIGRNSVIGANCVVTKCVPPYSVFVGNPGRVIKHFDLIKQAWVLGPVRSTGTELSKEFQRKEERAGVTRGALFPEGPEMCYESLLGPEEVTNG
jgi:acetyltransferase-like isoleucine patch superfamily enzyme